jgi:hypothetical protein
MGEGGYGGSGREDVCINTCGLQYFTLYDTVRLSGAHLPPLSALIFIIRRYTIIAVRYKLYKAFMTPGALIHAIPKCRRAVATTGL